MEIVVTGSLEQALTVLNRKMKRDGILRELKTRKLPKSSDRRKLKDHLARLRKSRDEAKRKKRRWITHGKCKFGDRKVGVAD
jgi:small subunit ribosomal protein S21